MKQNVNKKATCMNCGQRIDGAESIRYKDMDPRPGDICICGNCGFLGTYTEELFVKPMSSDDEKELYSNYPHLKNQILQARIIIEQENEHNEK